MTHTYSISGMTCEGCLHKVKHYISQIPDVSSVTVSLEENTATITASRPISDLEITKALGGESGKYQLKKADPVSEPTQSDTRSWLETYRPIVLIFSFITGVCLLVQLQNPGFDFMEAMRHFMAGFFLVFSFFKLLNLKGFAESYAMYDVIARKIPAWGYVYAFIELWLGIAYLVNFNPVFTNLMNLVVMSISIIGVLQTVLNKKKIQCACLGSVFNLPMSTVTIIEDGLMIVMSAVMLLMAV